MRKAMLSFSTVAVMALLVTACAGDSEDGTTTTSQGGTTTTSEPSNGEITEGTAITIEDFAFAGATSVTVGTTVTAINEDGVTHTWTSDDDVWDSGGLANGESFQFTFEEPGEYPYFCRIHPTMEGTITVVG